MSARLFIAYLASIVVTMIGFINWVGELKELGAPFFESFLIGALGLVIIILCLAEFYYEAAQ